MRVAPKNVQKGIKKWPQVIPARSNSGLGMDAQARMPKKPTFSTRVLIQIFVLATNRVSSPSSMTRSSSCAWPDNRAARAIKYGGNSPSAVPAPHMNASRRTLDMIWSKPITAWFGVTFSGHIILEKTQIRNWLNDYYIEQLTHRGMAAPGSPGCHIHMPLKWPTLYAAPSTARRYGGQFRGRPKIEFQGPANSHSRVAFSALIVGTMW